MVEPKRNFVGTFDVSCKASSVGRDFGSGDVIENRFL